MVSREISGINRKGEERSATVAERKGCNYLYVMAEPRPVLDNRPIFFINPDNGIAMNVNGAFSDTPDIVCNGSESSPADWPFSEPIGTKATDANTEQKNSGSNSVKWDNGAVGDQVRFTRASDLTIESFVAITLAIRVDKDWKSNDSISLSVLDSGVLIGNKVLLQDYFSFEEFDTWHNIAIPYAELGISTGTVDMVQLEIEARDGGKSPKFWFDDIHFEATGTPAEYRITKDPGYDFEVYKLRFTIVDNITTLEHGAFMGLSSLANGITYKRVQDGETQFSISLRNLGDLTVVGGNEVNRLTGATDTLITFEVEVQEPLVLAGSASRNYLSLTVADDLSSLVRFTAVARGVDRIE